MYLGEVIDGGAIAVVVAAGVLVAILVAVRLLSRDARLKRRIRGATPTTAAAASPGALVRLSGAIEPRGEPLRAPITGRPCVHFQARLLRHVQSGKHGRWVEVAREESSADFDLRDPTGAVWVQMTGAAVAVVRDHNTRSGLFDEPTEIEAAFLQRHLQPASNVIGFNHSYRYVEGVLALGEQVGALGTVEAVAGERVLRATGGAPLILSDDPSTLAPGSHRG